ncbi:hypothetical protein NHQ30_002987 [Ciborinia camelliae]|nr:hypothetical protein NHQ30_002987 [Ciborinia camelliae]
MNIQELPAEIFSKILLQAVIVRGITRALRLRLVNTYRVQNSLSLPRYIGIRHVAQRVCDETDADLIHTIEILCWPALEQSTDHNTDSNLKERPSNPDLDLLCAAAYLNLVPLAMRLIEKGVSPADKSLIFNSPMRLAAWAGNAQMLEMFQEHLNEAPETETKDVYDRALWNGKVNRQAIFGAAILGDLDMVKLAIYPPSRSSPESLDINGQKYGHVDWTSETGNSLTRAKCHTRNPDVYQYLRSLVTVMHPRQNDSNLAYHAYHGNLEIVRCALDFGADINGQVDGGVLMNPLASACRSGHSDIVSLLLERGVDVDFKGDMEVEICPAIFWAAQGGNFSIVRQLLENNASKENFKDGWVEAFWGAIKVEHTSMAKFILDFARKMEYHDVWEIHAGPMLMKARELGLESMVEFLLEEGVSTDKGITESHLLKRFFSYRHF